MTFTEWYIDWAANRQKTERLGQAFCNDFIKKSWPDLYYETDGYAAYSVITDYVLDNQWWDQLPHKQAVCTE